MNVGMARAVFRSDIDGLRAVAVLLVVVYHAEVFDFDSGFIGVDVFFVISGFLISRLLLKEARETNSVSLSSFWARRARRLLPAATTMVLAVAAGALALGSLLDWERIAGDLIAAGTYVANVRFAYQSGNYFAANLNASPLLHMWSLAVEEQFYLGWPVFLLVTWTVARGKRKPALVMFAAVSSLLLLSLAIDVWFTDRGSPWAFYGSPLRAWQLAAGCLVAMAEPTCSRLSRPRRSGVALLGLLIIILAVALIDERTRYPGVAALAPTLGAALLIAAGAGGPHALSSALDSPTAQWLGQRSYSWYLWHWPVLVGTRMAILQPTKLGLTLAVVASLALAGLTFRLIETPIRHAPRLASNRAALALALCCAALSASAAVVLHVAALHAAATPAGARIKYAVTDYPRFGKECQTIAGALTSPTCHGGDIGATPYILIAGDSHAQHWVPAFDDIGKSLKMRIVYTGLHSCPAVPVSVVRPEKLNPALKVCDTWHDEFINSPPSPPPDLLVLANSGEYLDARLTRDETGSLGWENAARRAHQTYAAVPRLVILDGPKFPFNPLDCIARQTVGCDIAVAEGVIPVSLTRTSDLAVAEANGSLVFDALPHLCPEGRCAAMAGTIIVFRDTHHITAAAARMMVPALMPVIAEGIKRE